MARKSKKKVSTGTDSEIVIDKIRILTEVWGALYRSVKKQWPGYENSIDENTIPKNDPLVADGGSWSMCLRKLETDLRQPSKDSKVYRHKERYVDETISLSLRESVYYFRDEIVRILKG